MFNLFSDSEMTMDFTKSHGLLIVDCRRAPNGQKYQIIKRVAQHFFESSAKCMNVEMLLSDTDEDWGGWNRGRAVPSSNQRTAPDHTTAATHLTLERQIQYIPNPIYSKSNILPIYFTELTSSHWTHLVEGNPIYSTELTFSTQIQYIPSHNYHLLNELLLSIEYLVSSIDWN